MTWAETALENWGLAGARIGEPISRENTVWKVEADGRALALRRHRPGYRSETELRSELAWVEMLFAAGLPTPKPVAAPDSALLVSVDGAQASVLTWLPGSQMGRTGAPLNLPEPEAIFERLGVVMARMHLASDAWSPPSGFTRHAWDQDGLIGEAPVWGCFWRAPFLSETDRDILITLRSEADALHAAFSNDSGLIHADLMRENVLISDCVPQMIDFDDGGWGPRLFDIATALVKNIDEPGFADLQAALLRGYRQHRPIDTDALSLMMALRAATYIGWLADRWDEPGAKERAGRNIDAAVRLARRALEIA
ncbi:MAG: phosphotransferase [Pseudomonadota bacterium]